MTKAEWGRGNTEGGMMGDGMTSEEGRGSLECGLRPVGTKGACPPACKPKAQNPTGWKRPRREIGIGNWEKAESWSTGALECWSNGLMNG